MTRSLDKLRKALRGCFGYREQQAAWDAVMPDWRWMLKRITYPGSHRKWSEADRVRMRESSQPLRDRDFVGRAWSQLLMQDFAREMTRLDKRTSAWARPTSSTTSSCAPKSTQTNAASGRSGPAPRTTGEWGWGWFPK